MKLFNSKNHYKSMGGYVLLLSVLISSIIIAIGLGITNLTLKGLVLSTAGRDSQFAFYAADSGGECALFWDIKAPGFGASVFPTSTESVVPSSGVVCGGNDIAVDWTVVRDANSATTEFTLQFINNRCATVLVSKTNGGADVSIQSRGYNSCDVNFPRRLERAIQITY